MNRSDYEERVSRYFERFPDRISYDPTSITFSIMLGLPPCECDGMCAEQGWDDDMYNEYDGCMEAVLEFLRARK